MKRSIAITSALVLALSSLLFVAEASARAGGGSSGGSRGSRSYSAPAPRSPSQVSPSRPTAPASPAAPSAMPQRSGWGGMLGGLLVGGLIGSLLFGGMGGGLGGLGGGIGLMEIVLIGGLIVFAIMWMRRRQAAAGAAGTPAYAGGYGGSSSGGRQPSGGSAYSGGGSSSAPVAALDAPAELSDLDRGVGHIRQMDAQFDPAAFGEKATDMFFKIQAAWTNRDMSRVTDLLTPEMRDVLQAQVDKLRADQRINRLENIAVRQAAVTEGWQEKGQDFVTVYFLASLVDYTTDESGAQVLDGSRTEPVKFEEYWTFARPVGPNPWKLSAIQQAA
jgi:predicted lipid-binding transport protein (Tim44 family)